MYNPVTRVKWAVEKHKSKIVFSAGIVTGVGGVVMFRRNIPVHIYAPIPTETLQHLIDHTEDSARYVSPKPLAIIDLFNDINLKNLEK